MDEENETGKGAPFPLFCLNLLKLEGEGCAGGCTAFWLAFILADVFVGLGFLRVEPVIAAAHLPRVGEERKWGSLYLKYEFVYI